MSSGTIAAIILAVVFVVLLLLVLVFKDFFCQKLCTSAGAEQTGAEQTGAEQSGAGQPGAEQSVAEQPSPRYLTTPTAYGCPGQTFELKDAPHEPLLWDGDKTSSFKRILKPIGDRLVCAQEWTKDLGVGVNGAYYDWAKNDPTLCYHMEKDVMDDSGNLDKSKCVDAPN